MSEGAMNDQERRTLISEIMQNVADVIGKTTIQIDYVYRDGDTVAKPDLRYTLDQLRDDMISRALEIEGEKEHDQ